MPTFDSSTAAIVLAMLGIPAGLIAGASFMGWLYRRDVRRAMRRPATGPGVDAPAGGALDRGPDGARLHRRALEGRPVLEPGVEPLIAEARDTTRGMHRAHAAAALAYGLVLSGGLVCLWSQVSLDARLATAYFLLLPQLAMLAWFLGVPPRRQLVHLAGLVLAGVVLLLGLSGPQRAGRLAMALGPWFGLLPFAGGVLLVARRLRPFIAFLAALLLFLLAGASLASGLLRWAGESLTGATLRPLVVAIGVFNAAAGVVVFGWLLRKRSWRVPVMALLVTAGVVAHELLGPLDLVSGIFYGVAFNVVQVFLLWLILKGLVLLGERHLLSSEVLHSHLCWGLLTLYLFAWSTGRALWGDPLWLRATLVLAFACHLLVLHLLVRRVRARRAGRPSLRLLLLRVFGHGGVREKLLEHLDDTWRRVGRIDLLEGTDLAVPAMSAAMLEAFLLRRVGGQFLKTTEDVDRRLARLRSSLEGDARYPVNSVSCDESVWKDAFGRLAMGVDAVMMDLRGLTRGNQGSLLELAYLVQRVALDRIFLLVDATTDLRALDDTTAAAWSALPADSPNAANSQPSLMTVWLGGARDDHDLLFEVLLNAALPVLPVGAGARCGPPGPG